MNKPYQSPMVAPLDSNGRIYALYDERGIIIGTGTRDVCRVLLHIVTRTITPQNKSQKGMVEIKARAARG
jgi:hypothetical protein